MSAFIYTAMVNYPMEANFMKPLPAYPVQKVLQLTLLHMNLQTLVKIPSTLTKTLVLQLLLQIFRHALDVDVQNY